MRGNAVIVAVILLLATFLAPCPSCLQAEAESVPVDLHACCARAQNHGESPASDDTERSEDRPECPNYGFVQTLADLKAEAVAERAAESIGRLPGMSTVVDTLHGAAGIVVVRVVVPLADFVGSLVLPDAFVLVPLRI